MTDERVAELISKLEEATTDGDLSSLTQDDIGDVYSWMLEQQTWRGVEESDTPQAPSPSKFAQRIVKALCLMIRDCSCESCHSECIGCEECAECQIAMRETVSDVLTKSWAGARVETPKPEGK